MDDSQMTAVQVGQPILLHQNGQIGIIKFAGPTSFAPGDWVGVELETKDGKNDGSVQGRRYFDCEMGYGMFVRPSAVSIIDEGELSAGQEDSQLARSALREDSYDSYDSPGSSQARPGKLSNGNGRASAKPTEIKRQSIAPRLLEERRESAVIRRQSTMPGSPTPGPRPSNGTRSLASPTQSPTRSPSRPTAPAALARRAGSGQSANSVGSQRAALNGIKHGVGQGRRTSMAPPSFSQPSNGSKRQSILGTKPVLAPPSSSIVPARAVRPAALRQTTSRLSIKPTPLPRPPPPMSKEVNESPLLEPIDTSVHQDESFESEPVIGEPGSHRDTHPPPPPIPDDPPNPARAGYSGRASFGSRGRISPTPSLRSNAASQRENEDLKTKLRMMEKKRMEDRDKLKGMEKLQQERDRFEMIIQRLQNKLQPQQQELADLRKQLREANAKAEEVADRHGEHESMLELATLDREMAEEQAEALRSELDTLKLRVEELQLELEVLREDNQELNKDMSPEEKSSQGWLQLERQNERLRDALLALRDVSQRTEVELKDQIQELEQDDESLSNIRGQYESVSEKLQLAESNVEDLRGQLDAASGAQDMIEDLTAQNGSLEGQIAELHLAVQDLEALKELNDELDLNHVETEQQLEEEIAEKEALLNEQYRQVNQQNDALVDYEYTISKFRQLVKDLQTEIEKMRSDREISEVEAGELNQRSRNMIEMNMSLQASAAKTQVKGLELELERLQAQQDRDLLEMTTPFLIDSFDAEREPLMALLRFKRIRGKADLLRDTITSRVKNPIPGGYEGAFIGQCQALRNLVETEGICRRMIQHAHTCDLPQFAKLAGSTYDLESTERIVDKAISHVKADSLRETDLAQELDRTLLVLRHLAEMTLVEGDDEELASRADRLLGDVEQTVRQLEIATILLDQSQGRAKDREMRHRALEDEEDVNDADARMWLRKVDDARSTIKSCLTAAQRTYASLTEYQSRSMTLSPQHLDENMAATSSLMAAANDQLRILALHSLSDPSTDTSTSTSSIPPTDTLPPLLQTLDTLQKFSTTPLSYTEYERPPFLPPWRLRAQHLKSSTLPDPSTTALLDSTRDRLASATQQNETLRNTASEQALKLEVLAGKMADVGRWRARVVELEGENGVLAGERKRLADENVAGVRLLDGLEAELQGTRERLADALEAAGEQQLLRRRRDGGGSADEGEGGVGGQMGGRGARLEVGMLRCRVKELEATIAYLMGRQREREVGTVGGGVARSRFGALRVEAAGLDRPLRRRKDVREREIERVAAEGRRALGGLLGLCLAQTADLATYRVAGSAGAGAGARGEAAVEQVPKPDLPTGTEAQARLVTATVGAPMPVPTSSLKTWRPLARRLTYKLAGREVQFMAWRDRGAELVREGRQALHSSGVRDAASGLSRGVEEGVVGLSYGLRKGLAGRVRIAGEGGDVFEDGVEFIG